MWYVIIWSGLVPHFLFGSATLSSDSVYAEHRVFLFNYSSFQRVLPLPSDSWEEVSSHLFCHRHDNHGDGKDLSSPVKLLPKEGDCLISYDLILLRTSALDCDTITAKDEVEFMHAC